MDDIIWFIAIGALFVLLGIVFVRLGLAIWKKHCQVRLLLRMNHRTGSKTPCEINRGGN